jgi:hypothetical protein
MIHNYVNKLIENLPDDTTKNNIRIDLVLDGGAFNGSYLVGALYFLKEMERRKYVKVERISGCSIGSLVGFLYLLDSLDIMTPLYDIVNRDIKTNCSLPSMLTLKQHIGHIIPEDVCSKVNGKLYICYNDLKKRKKIVKSVYKDVDDIIDTIIKSSYLPILIDHNLCYKKRYIDGINAYIFKDRPDRKILHMELFGYDKASYAMNIKNEKTNFHRILSGLLDIHSFFIKQTPTAMCSYVNEWSLLNNINYNVKLFMENLLLFIICIILYVKKCIPSNIKENLHVKIASKIIFGIFRTIFESYCL